MRKKDEPFATILRARPKHPREHFERFIVLGDANQKNVEERLGNALLYHQVISKMQEKNQNVIYDKDQQKKIGIANVQNLGLSDEKFYEGPKKMMHETKGLNPADIAT